MSKALWLDRLEKELPEVLYLSRKYIDSLLVLRGDCQCHYTDLGSPNDSRASSECGYR